MSVSFDRVASIYDATRGLPESVSEQVTECILNLVSATPDTKFFEPGIGTGRIALPIVKKGYSYTGVDISQKMMDELRHKLQDVPKNLTLLEADATSLPFDNDYFDVALTVHVLHLIPAWREALAEIRRVLKPGGVFLYCHDKGSFYAYNAFDEQWKVMIEKHGFSLTRYGAANNEVLEVLIEQGAILEKVTVAEWQTVRTVGELLYAYQGRFFSSSWQIPDHIFSQAIQEFQDWALSTYESQDTVLYSDSRFELTMARHWS